MTTGFFKRVVDLAVFVGAACPRQLVGADDVETVAGEIKILIGKLFAGGHVQHHQIVIRVRTHPQEQRLFILLDSFIIKEGKRAAGIQPFVVQQAAAAVHHACENEFEPGTRRKRDLFAGKQLQPAGTDVAFTKQHQADAFFRAEQGGMQTLNQAFGWPFAQNGNQADALFRLPGKFHRLAFQLLPEAVAVQRVTGDARAHHRHQRQPLTQAKLARQTGFIQNFQGTVRHFCGIAELQQLAVIVNTHGQRTHLGAFQDRVDLFMRQPEVLARRNLELNQANVVVAGNNTRPGTGGQHALNARGALIRGVAAAQLQVDIATGNRLQRTGVQHRCRQTRQLAGFIQAQQRQQAGIFYFARVRAINTGHVAPDGDAGHARQSTDLRRRVVGAVTAQQHGFTRVAAADKAGNHNAFARVLHQQLLQQRVG